MRGGTFQQLGPQMGGGSAPGGSAEAPGWEAGAPMRGLSSGWGSPFRAARLWDSGRGYAPALRQGSRAKSKAEQAQGDGLWRSNWG